MSRFFLLVLLVWGFTSCNYQNDRIVKISTSKGDIKVRLYNDTPIHRDNFLKLVKEKFYDGILFHRVIENFMIQAGDPTSKDAKSETLLGEGDSGNTLDAEFRPRHFHKKGVLAAAREGDDTNPLRKSSGSHFYIVQGKKYSSGDLNDVVERINERRKIALYNRLKNEHKAEYTRLQETDSQKEMDELTEKISLACDSLFGKERLILTPEQKQVYVSEGGTPHLDGQYTVFGEVIEGLDVIDKIAAVKTDSNDRPLENVVILDMTIEK